MQKQLFLMMSKFKKTWSADIFLVFCYRILIVYILYTFSRFIFYIYNIDHFNISFGRLITIFYGGLVFDTSAIIYTNLLFILVSLLPFKFRHRRGYQSAVKYIFIIANSIALFSNFADIPYFGFVLERTTINIFSQFKHEKNIGLLFFKFVFDYWKITLLYIFTIFSMVYLYNRVRISEPFPKKSILYYPVSLVLLLGVIVLVIGGARGGYQHSTRPITLSNAGQFVKAPAEMAIVLNTPFCLIRSTESEAYEYVDYFKSNDELQKVYSPVHKPDLTRKQIKDNVVIFILESFNKEFIGSLNKNLDHGTYKGYAPFLDSLIRFSKTFKYSFANGRRSIEALPSVLTSLPSIEYPFILSPYYSNTLSSLPGLLKEKGYKSAFFHGAPNGSMGFQAFGQLIGVDEYYGKTEYNNDKDFDGIWGIWDEEFFQFFANTMDTFSKPFIATIFSVTSHHPFIVPEKYKGKFKMKDFPLQQCIEYTDLSLRHFFSTASKMPWYKNTLFIFTADHVSLNQRPEFINDMGYFAVPIILFRPGSNITGIDTVTIAQQIDIMPTVLDYLGYNKEYIAFGQDLLNPDTSKFAVNYLFGTYRIYKNGYILFFDGKKSIHLYNFKADPMLTNDIITSNPTVKNRMEILIKAFIQQFKNRMIENKLLINTN